jgi:hypothetical protein
MRAHLMMFVLLVLLPARRYFATMPMRSHSAGLSKRINTYT